MQLWFGLKVYFITLGEVWKPLYSEIIKIATMFLCSMSQFAVYHTHMAVPFPLRLLL